MKINVSWNTKLAETWYRYDARKKLDIELKAKNAKYRKKFGQESPEFLHEIEKLATEIKEEGVKLYELLGDKAYILDENTVIFYFQQSDSFYAIPLYKDKGKS